PDGGATMRVSSRGRWPQFTDADAAFVDACLERTEAGLSEPLRLGVAIRRVGAGGGLFAYGIPPDLWDGDPDAQGLVRWRRRTVDPPSPSGAWDLYQSRTPPMLKAYLRTQRLPRVPLRLGDLSVVLPGT